MLCKSNITNECITLVFISKCICSDGEKSEEAQKDQPEDKADIKQVPALIILPFFNL
jgi:hypothetical protein